MNEFEDEDNELQAINKAPVQYKGPKEGRKFLSDDKRKKLFGLDPHKDMKKRKNPHKRSNDEFSKNNEKGENPVSAYILAKQARYRKNSDTRDHHKDIKSFTPKEDDYDYQELAKLEPRLKPVLTEQGVDEAKHKYTLNWKEKGQAYYLNKAILQFDYGITHYDLPEEEGLVPAVPSRREYIYWIRDLFEQQESVDKPLKGLDIGVGANCIYPILGNKEFGWSFVGSDISKESIDIAQGIIDNNSLNDHITLKLQTGKRSEGETHGPIFEIFENILDKDSSEKEFDFSMCNPPFFSSMNERIDRRSVKVIPTKKEEETTPGGEIGFLCRMVKESVKYRHKITWFTTFIGRKMDFVFLQKYLDTMVPHDIIYTSGTIEKGFTKRWLLAWKFQD